MTASDAEGMVEREGEDRSRGKNQEVGGRGKGRGEERRWKMPVSDDCCYVHGIT